MTAAEKAVPAQKPAEKDPEAAQESSEQARKTFSAKNITIASIIGLAVLLLGSLCIWRSRSAERLLASSAPEEEFEESASSSQFFDLEKIKQGNVVESYTRFDDRVKIERIIPRDASKPPEFSILAFKSKDAFRRQLNALEAAASTYVPKIFHADAKKGTIIIQALSDLEARDLSQLRRNIAHLVLAIESIQAKRIVNGLAGAAFFLTDSQTRPLIVDFTRSVVLPSGAADVPIEDLQLDSDFELFLGKDAKRAGFELDWMNLAQLISIITTRLGLLFKVKSFNELSVVQVINEKLTFRQSFNEESVNLKSLLKKLVSVDPENLKESVEGIKAEPFFKSIDWTRLQSDSEYLKADPSSLH